MINIKSDFKILTKIVNGKGEVLSPFSLDFEFIYTDIANKSIKYTISNLKGVQTNCKALDDNLILIFQNHGFTNFKIKETRHFYIPDKDFEDTIYDVYQDNIIDLNCINEKDSALNKHLYVLTKNEEIIAPYYRGETAYEAALKGGYKGTIEQFYNDLAVDVNIEQVVNNKLNNNFLIIPYAFTQLEYAPSTESILYSLNMHRIEQLEAVINNINDNLYKCIYIKDETFLSFYKRLIPISYEFEFNSNTSWTLKFFYVFNRYYIDITLRREQDTLIYNKQGEQYATQRFVADRCYSKNEVEASLQTKVDKVYGKQLSTNDYTNEEKNKLASLSNYNDIELRDLIGNTYTKSEVDTKISEIVTSGGENGGGKSTSQIIILNLKQIQRF